MNTLAEINIERTQYVAPFLLNIFLNLKQIWYYIVNIFAHLGFDFKELSI
jgi:hypothetical protein